MSIFMKMFRSKMTMINEGVQQIIMSNLLDKAQFVSLEIAPRKTAHMVQNSRLKMFFVLPGR